MLSASLNKKSLTSCRVQSEHIQQSVLKINIRSAFFFSCFLCVCVWGGGGGGEWRGEIFVCFCLFVCLFFFNLVYSIIVYVTSVFVVLLTSASGFLTPYLSGSLP